MTPTEKRLREALEPFAALANEIEFYANQYPTGASERDPSNWLKGCQWSDLLAARKALAAVPSETGTEETISDQLRRLVLSLAVECSCPNCVRHIEQRREAWERKIFNAFCRMSDSRVEFLQTQLAQAQHELEEATSPAVTKAMQAYYSRVAEIQDERIKTIEAQLASLRGRVVGECAPVIKSLAALSSTAPSETEKRADLSFTGYIEQILIPTANRRGK